MTIEPATTPDAPAIAAVHVRSWQAAYAGILDARFLRELSVERRTEQWRGILEKNESTTLVARHDAAVVGFVSFGHWRNRADLDTHGEIWALYAQPESWGIGVGRALLDAALRQLRDAGRHTVSLWVIRANARALRFYRAFGFEVVEGSGQVFELGGRHVEELCLRLHGDD